MPVAQMQQSKRAGDFEVPNTKRAKDDSITATVEVDGISKPDSLEDQLQDKVDMICSAMKEEEFVVAGPPSCKQMLLAIAPFTLGTPSDKRTGHQQAVARMIGEAFEAEGQRLQLLVDEAQAEADPVNAEKDNLQSKIDGHEADLLAKIEEIKKKEATLKEDIDNTQDAKDELQEAVDQQGTAEAAKSTVSQEHEKYQSAKVHSFDVLRDGTCENAKEQKQHISVLTPIFKKLKADVSLIGALASALGKKPEERGDFDVMVVQQLEEFLAQQLVAVGKRLEDASAALEAQTAEVDAKQVVLEAYQEKQEDCEASIRVANVEREEIEAAVADAQLAAKTHKAAAAKVLNHFRMVNMNNKFHHDLVKELSWLQEYTSTEVHGNDAPMVEA